MPESFLLALLGGGLIGLAATVLLLMTGRVAGISGIFFGLLKPHPGETLWRFKFIVGLLLGGLLMGMIVPDSLIQTTSRGPWLTILAGFLVGFGTRMGSGCTSGHGVCGISRLSPRSIVATLTFMTAGVAVVALINLVVGGI